ncbi:hypothetical protein EHS39_09155 [Ensifer sp. MPMI2T]|nr:hypothetical protein EHS39_09155 [Ensifer sp. MPMI2T]
MARPPKKPAKSAAKKASSPKPKEKPADLIVSQTEMAEILGVTTRWLRQMVTEGVVPSEGRGRFRISATVRAYATFLKDGTEKKTGSTSMDELRKEKALEIRMNRERKDRDLIAIDEALSTADEIAGIFVAYLSGLPAEITGVPRERQRLNEIIDGGRLRLADRFAEKIEALRTGKEDPDSEAED